MIEGMDIKKILSDVDIPTTSEDINRIDPKVMAAIMAMAQAGQLNKIRRNLEDRTSAGWTQSVSMTVTTAPPGDGYELDKPGQSISVTNDGPNTLLIGLNDFFNPHQINSGEVFNVNFDAHKLVTVFWQAVGGNTNARVLVKG